MTKASDKGICGLSAHDGLWRAVAGLLGLAAILLVFYATSGYGINVSSDSVAYIAAADSFAQGKGFLTCEEIYFALWPPMYPIILSISHLLGVTTYCFARCLSAFMFGALVVMTAWVLHKAVRCWLAGAIGALCLLVSGVMAVYLMAWSETVFNLLALIVLYLVHRSCVSASLKPFICAALATMIACVTRYVGVTLVLTAGLMIITDSRLSFGKRIARGVVFGLISLLPFIAWIVRNALLTGLLTGERYRSTDTLFLCTANLSRNLVSWLLPFIDSVTSVEHSFLSNLSMIIGLVIILAVLGIIIWHCMRFSGAKRMRHPLTPFIVFIPVYAVYLTLSSWKTALDPIDRRYVSPLYAPVIIVVAGFLCELAWGGLGALGSAITHPRLLKFVRGVIVCFAVLWLMLNVARAAKVTRDARLTGRGGGACGYTDKGWVDSEIMHYLKTNPPAPLLITNEPPALYANFGWTSRMAPKKTLYRGVEYIGDESIAKLKEAINKREEAHIVWFDFSPVNYLFTPNEMKEHFDIQPVRLFKAGGVYRIRDRQKNS